MGRLRTRRVRIERGDFLSFTPSCRLPFYVLFLPMCRHRVLVPNASIHTILSAHPPSSPPRFPLLLVSSSFLPLPLLTLRSGSLVNSGVSIAPDRRVFDEDQWPAGIQKDRDTKLKDGFDRAASVLRPAQYPDQDTHPLPRVTRMQEAAAHLRETGYPAAKAVLADVNVSFREAAPNPQGVPQPACTLCGDCNTGCNVGAKNTVLMNYLRTVICWQTHPL